MNLIIRNLVHFGSLFWILPVTTLPGEAECAFESAWTWIDGPQGSDSPFEHAEFPFLAYLRECFRSDSMRNRRRLWGIVKQYDRLWDDYRAGITRVERNPA